MISRTQALPQGEEAVEWPHPMRAWFTVGILMLAYATAFIDRQILTLLVDPVKSDLQISDTEFSLLSGLAFTIFYTLLGVPLAWIADRGSRRNLIIVGIGVWSVMTALCGLATSFFSLFLARIGVGIGEAGLSPAAYSMIADSFPQSARARAMGVYAMGAIMGVGLALMIGGMIVEWTAAIPPVELPVVGALKGWQLAFLAVSVPGPLIMLVLLFVREPVRQGVAHMPREAPEPIVPFLRAQGPLLALLTVGYSMLGLVIAAYLTWIPAFLTRVHGWQVGEVGLIFGGLLVLCSTLGVLLGGAISAWFIRRGRPDGIVRTAIYGGLFCFPFAVSMPLVAADEMAVLLLGLACLGFGIFQGLPAATLQSITPNRLRARILALYLLVGNLVAFTIGPTAVALISDYWLRDPAKIGVAIAICSVVAIPVGVAALLAARTSFVRRIETLA